MATRSVQILVKARDEASKKFGHIGKSAGGLSSSLKKLAAAAGLYFGAREIKSFLTGSLTLYGQQERAVRGLSDALGLLGKGGANAMKGMKEFASSIQKVTIHGDETVLELMKMGAAMGKLSGRDLQEATKAAIGLAEAYTIDVVAAMRLVSRARMGDVSTLTKYGIKLGEGLNAQQKFNKILEIGIRNFKLAEVGTSDYERIIKQTKNSLSDLREEIGKALAPAVMNFARKLKGLDTDTVRTTGNFIKWTAAISAGVYLGPKIITTVVGITKAMKGLAAGQAIVKGLSGPAGWASLAAGAGVAAVSVGLIERAFGGFNSEVVEAQKGMRELSETTRELSSSLENLNEQQKKSMPLWKAILISLSPIAVGFTIIRALVRGKQSVTQGLSDMADQGDRVQANLSGAAISADKYAEAMKRLKESVTGSAPWKKIAEEITELQGQVRNFASTEKELFLQRMKEAGYSEQSMEMVKRYQKQKEFLEGQKILTEALAETTKNLRRELELFGKDDLERKLFDLEALGADEHHLKVIRDQMDQLRAMRKEEEKGIKDLRLEIEKTVRPTEGRFLSRASGGQEYSAWHSSWKQSRRNENSDRQPLTTYARDISMKGTIGQRSDRLQTEKISTMADSSQRINVAINKTNSLLEKIIKKIDSAKKRQNNTVELTTSNLS